MSKLRRKPFFITVLSYLYTLKYVLSVKNTNLQAIGIQDNAYYIVYDSYFDVWW